MNKLLQKVAKLFLGISMAAGVGVAIGAGRKDASPVHAASYSHAFTYSEQGSGTGKTWQLTNCSDQKSYWLCPDGATTSVATFSGIFTDKTITSEVTITINNGTYSSGTNPSASTFQIYNSSACTSQVTAAQSGTLATSKTYVDTIYTVSQTNASSGFTSDLAIKITKPGKQIRLVKVTVAFSYTPAESYTLSFNANGGSGTVPDNITGTGSKTLPSSASLTKTGYTLDGWGDLSHKDDASAQYDLGDSYTLSADATLYAHWTANKYSVSASITNGGFTGTTGANAATYGTAYTATITANTKYKLPSDLTVTMGGSATNAYTYSSSTGAFSIPSPTGNISITGTCTPDATEYEIETTATNGTYSGDTSIYSGFTASITFTANDHYKLPSSSDAFTVEHAEIKSYNSSTGVLVLENPDDDVTVSVSMVAKAQNKISMGTLTGVSQANGNPTTVEEGATVTLTFIANENYGLPTSSGVTVSGTGATSTWTQGTGKLQITGGTGDITVSITGIAKVVSSITLSSTSGTYTLGDTFTMPTVTANYNIGGSDNVTSQASATGGGLENGIFTSAGTKTITISYGGQSATYTATVNAVVPSVAGIRKVTSTSDLTVGSTVYLVCEGRSKQLSGISTTSTKYGLGTDYTTTPSNTYPLTVAAGNGGTGYAFKNSSNNYLYWTSGNTLNVNSTLSNNTSWTVSFDASGNATILNVADDSREIMWNYSSPRFACYSGQTPTYDTAQGYNMVQLYKNFPAVVRSLKWITATVNSGSYYKGNTVTASNFTVTAHYDNGDSETVSNNITVTNGTLNNLGTNDVTLTYGGKSCVVQVTATYAPVTGITLSPSSASIALGESYWLSDIGVTVNPSNTNQEVTWELYNDGGLVEDSDYTFDGDEYHSINEGTVVFRCKSVLDNTKYADFTLTIAGDPVAEFAKDSTSGYTGKNETISFTYGNFDSEDLEIVSGNTSYVTIGTISASNGSGSVVINFVGAGSTSVTISDGVSTLDTLTVTVSADSVTSVTWSASNIDVFSGATLSTTGWNVQYEMASGDSGAAATYTIKLGSETVTSGYTFKALDSGKTMHVEYGGISSSSITVTVTQSINNVMGITYTENEWSHTIQSQTWSSYGEQTISSKAWTADATDGDYWGYDGTKGQQFGKAKDPCAELTLTSTAFSGTISTVKVSTSGAQGIDAVLSVTVGSTSFKSSGNTSVAIDDTNTEYTFTGSATGTITITWTNSSEKAIYVKALGVTTLSASGTQQIANNASHKAAQRAAVAYAQAFNAAMDNTENCTTGLDSAWSTCSSAYTSFKSAAAALGETEEEWALNLVKYATAQYSDDSGEACIERMMKTYEICVQKYGKTAFMSDLVSLDAPQVSPLVNIIGENTNTVAIIVIISMVSVTAIGGYFFIRKRKEQ